MQSESYVTKLPLHKADFWKNSKPLLGRLDMELTERCNNNCLHCCINLPADDLKAQERELTTSQIKGILKEAASLGCITVRFTGGEPLLRDDFEELYIFARKIGLRVLIFTNATLIDRHLAELFSRIPPLERIEVSLYGMRRKSYEAVTRTPDSFEAAWRGINLLLEHKIPFVVKNAFLESNKDEVHEFEAWAGSIPWMDTLPSYSMFFDLRCRKDTHARNRLIHSLRVSPEEGLKMFTRKKEEYLKEMREFCSKFMHSSGEKLFSCGAGCASGCVDAYGILQPCIMVRHPACVYDLKRGALKDAFTNFFPKMRHAKAANPKYLARCGRCFLKGLCEQCPAKSWTEHGTLDTPVEYLCKVAHLQARYLGLLQEKEKAWEVENWITRIKEFAGQEGANAIKN